MSAALVAAREGFPDSLKILLGTGKLEADLTDDNGWTLLRTSSWSGQPDCVQLLLRAGAEVNRQDRDRRTALRAACWAGHIECVKELLEAGAEINQMDSEGRTALIAACYMGHLDCVRELIIWGADIDQLKGSFQEAVKAAASGSRCAPEISLIKFLGSNDHTAFDGPVCALAKTIRAATASAPEAEMKALLASAQSLTECRQVL